MRCVKFKELRKKILIPSPGERSDVGNADSRLRYITILLFSWSTKLYYIFIGMEGEGREGKLYYTILYYIFIGIPTLSFERPNWDS